VLAAKPAPDCVAISIQHPHIAAAYRERDTMAGRVRQPIDTRSLETWISRNVPEIEVPLEIKQVRSPVFAR